MARIIAVLTLLGVVWPVLRMVGSRAFRNRLGAHPGLRLKVLAALSLYLAGVALLALGPLWLVSAAAVTALVAALLAWWRARPDFGQGRGLPRGSLAATGLAMVTDDRHLLEQARAHGPVFKIGRFGRPIACVVGIRRGSELLRRHDDDLTSGALPFSRLIDGGFIRYMPPERHARYRKLLARAFGPELVHGGRPTIETTARAVLAGMACAGNRSGRGLNPAPHLLRYTTRCMLQLVFGFGAGDPRLARALDLYPIIASARLSRVRQRRVHAALEELHHLVGEAAAEAKPGRAGAGGRVGGLDLVAAQKPQARHDPTLLGNLVYLVETGGRDTADLLLWSLKMLADQPAWAERLRHADDDLAERVVAETLRLEQSEYVVRTARRPLAVEGYTIPKGWLVRICVRESHRDPAAFADPERFDPDRFLRNAHEPRDYAPFGFGAHTCLGRGLVTAMASTFLRELAHGFDWRVTGDGPREFGSFHWMPNSGFTIALTPRPAPAVSGAEQVALTTTPSGLARCPART